MHGAITTYKNDTSIVDEIVQECLFLTVTLSRKTMMGVFKGTRSSDSWRKAFVQRVREIDVTVNRSISMLVVRKGC